MKVVKFKKSFQVSDAKGKNLKIANNGYYVFSDFVLKQFIDSVKVNPTELLEYVNELDREYPLMRFDKPDSQIKPNRALMIVRTGGIGDLIALSHIPTLCKTIYNNVYGQNLKTFFVTDARYSAVFTYYDEYVKPIYYFRTPVNKAFKEMGIFEKSSVRSMFFEGVIEESEENWFDLQWERMGIDKFQHLDKLPDEIKIKRPNLVDRREAISRSLDQLRFEKSDVPRQLLGLKEDGYRLVLINHRASAWIRTFNPSDVVETLRDYLKENGVEKVKFIVFPRNFTKSDEEYFKNPLDDVVCLKTENLHEFFFTIAISDYVISSDTAAHHFREGIRAPGMGIYSSFPMEMRCKYYKYTVAENILFDGCEFVCDWSNYVGCVSHFKNPYEVCPWIAKRYSEYLKSEHHHKRGNRIPNKTWLSELEDFVKNVGYDTLQEEHIFQYAPCCDSRWNERFRDRLIELYEKHDLAGILKDVGGAEFTVVGSQTKPLSKTKKKTSGKRGRPRKKK